MAAGVLLGLRRVLGFVLGFGSVSGFEFWVCSRIRVMSPYSQNVNLRLNAAAAAAALNPKP